MSIPVLAVVPHLAVCFMSTIQFNLSLLFCYCSCVLVQPRSSANLIPKVLPDPANSYIALPTPV
ncbi:hypothetical protein EX30DRAFT_342357 [Ascodesmis nigricans]|uniref:Uncharacterized protein n=1 Tax=Ascodesmis nigricans TaxID=341454 RepID=A0A4S2MQN4_9PEZI|nr:hypothetical protein EX30DRAFT_342357 [Ascodesmis nigricans]